MPAHQEVHDALFPPVRHKSRTSSPRGDYQYTPENRAKLVAEWDAFEKQALEANPSYISQRPAWLKDVGDSYEPWRARFARMYPNMPRWQQWLHEWARLEQKMGWQWVQDEKLKAKERRMRASKARRAQYARVRRARWCKENLT